MRIKQQVSILFVGVALAASCAGAQTNRSPDGAIRLARPLAFEVASVRRSKAGEYYGMKFNADGFVATHTSLHAILRAAFDQYQDQSWSGTPGWLDSEYYNINAKFNPADFPGLTFVQRRAMLQALLAERFSLAIHVTTKVLPHFALFVARGGPKLKETRPETIVTDPQYGPYCIRANNTSFTQCTMAEFAFTAGFLTKSVVEDRTGLTARYDFILSAAPPGAGDSNSPDALPDLFVAVRQQLGLKLEPAKGPVSVLVIDHVERPTEN